MSVDISRRPWKFAQDGSGTNPVGFSYFGEVYFQDCVITKVANLGDRIYFTDFAGGTVIDFTAEQAQDSFRMGKQGWINGLKCVQFDSGEMIVAP